MHDPGGARRKSMSRKVLLKGDDRLPRGFVPSVCLAGGDMHRRSFLAGLVSVAATPGVAKAQQPDRVRRIGVLIPYAESDAESQVRFRVFEQTLQQLGWTDGRNVRIDY